MVLDDCAPRLWATSVKVRPALTGATIENRGDVRFSRLARNELLGQRFTFQRQSGLAKEFSNGQYS